MDENPHRIAISPKKRAANRRNAQRSTGPRTEEGKRRSRRNALKHGILASALVIDGEEGTEDRAEFEELLDGLQLDLSPVGALEEMLVEKIAVCWWRQKRALKCEGGLVRQRVLTESDSGLRNAIQRKFPDSLDAQALDDQLSLPLSVDLDRILRYETANQRQLAYAINQLERLQRARKGEHVPAPVSVQVSNDQ
jgi:hypothetical protein